MSGLAEETFAAYGGGQVNYEGEGVGTVVFRIRDVLVKVTYSELRDHKPMPQKMAIENAYQVAEDVATKLNDA